MLRLSSTPLDLDPGLFKNLWLEDRPALWNRCGEFLEAGVVDRILTLGLKEA